MSGTTAPTPEELCKRARGVFDSFEPDDLQRAIDEACDYVNPRAWGSRFCDGVYYLACHILTVEAAIGASGDAASSADAMPAGPLKSEAILSWRGSYAVSEGTDGDDDAFRTTVWGREYLARCKRVFSCRLL